jgi:hypothetical protein
LNKGSGFELVLKMTSKAYQLAICEVFHPAIHGQDESSSPNVHTQFLIYAPISIADFYSQAYLTEENHLRRYRHALRLMLLHETHPTIRNYRRVANKYIRLEIIQADVLRGCEEVAYLKTFWLRVVQRRWKKIYKARKDLLRQRSTPAALAERQRTGQWPVQLRRWPRFTLNNA